MSNHKKKRRNLFVESLKGKLSLSVTHKELCLHFLIDLVKKIRPKFYHSSGSAEFRLKLICGKLEESPATLKNLQIALTSQLLETDLTPALTESGILMSRGFVQEFITRLFHKVLPPLQDEADFLYVINRIFYKKKDYIWVEKISRETWKAFFSVIGIHSFSTNEKVLQQFRRALTILSYKVAQPGLDKEISQYLSDEDAANNPFYEQNLYLTQLQNIVTYSLPGEYNLIRDLNVAIDRSLECLYDIRDAQSVKGASLSLTYTTLVMGYCLHRMKLLVDFIDNDNEFNLSRLVDFFRLIVRNEKRKNSLRELLSQSFGYIAYQIAEHKGSKGGKYITTTRKEYYQMLVSALRGGFIISFIAMFKNMLSLLHLAPFWQCFAYSVNYSAGFLIIEETHSTLATKQPAFTASAVAESLDTRKNDQPNLYNLAITVARVVRSQFASFAGNLLAVFPITFLLAWVYELIFGHKLAGGAEALKLLEEQHPTHSLSLLYACNTGAFLFISGLIAGFIQNQINYSKVKERLIKHPVLRITIPKRRLEKIATYIEGHAGSITGNIMLGFFLGMSGFIVKVFAIPFDIRHITISAANVAIGLYGTGFQGLTWQYISIVMLGVLGIGFFNFLVSFSLAFIVAVKSRGIKLSDYPEFLKILLRYFIHYPLDFIRPRKKPHDLKV